MKISVIGAGYVGLTSAICFACNGHNVICVDKDSNKINLLKNKIPTIYEEHIRDKLSESINNNKIEFTTNISYGIKNSEIILLSVGTPQDEKTGNVNLDHVYAVSKESAKFINEYKLFVIKSTVPVGTNQKIKQIIQDISNFQIDVASNPEFMREGFAIEDFLRPDRIVIGTESKKAEQLMKNLYKNWIVNNCPVVFTDIKTAELIKYASNSFLMTKIAFVNEIETLCRKLNCNIKDLTKSMGLDKRIGKAFLNPGPGIGGSCFPKDANALCYIANAHNMNLSILEQVIDSNENRFAEMSNLIKSYFCNNKKKELSILGLSFKAGTDDVRMSPSIKIINKLIDCNFKIFAYDPQAIQNAKLILKDNIIYCNSLHECYKQTDNIVILTEWSEFKKIKNFTDFKEKTIIDLRKIF